MYRFYFSHETEKLALHYAFFPPFSSRVHWLGMYIYWSLWIFEQAKVQWEENGLGWLAKSCTAPNLQRHSVHGRKGWLPSTWSHYRVFISHVQKIIYSNSSRICSLQVLQSLMHWRFLVKTTHSDVTWKKRESKKAHKGNDNDKWQCICRPTL